MAKQRRRKPKTPTPKKTRSLGRRQRRQRGLPERGSQVQTTIRMISGPLGLIRDDECECVICEVLREELGEIPEVVDMAQLSPEGRARIDAAQQPWNPF